MDNNLFFNELSRQIRFVFIAVEDINSELNKRRDINMDRFWYSVQSFLISVANISKILYPSPISKETNKQRAKLLREELKLEENSILADKKIRNCFEHFDEHLDNFVSDYEKNHGNYVDSNIGDSNGIVIGGMSKNLYLRNYNPKTNTLTFKNISYELQPVVNELVKLKQKLEELDPMLKMINDLKKQ